jgi:hypothetical protein
MLLNNLHTSCLNPASFHQSNPEDSETSLLRHSLVTPPDWLTGKDMTIPFTTVCKKAAASRFGAVACAFPVIFVKV